MYNLAKSSSQSKDPYNFTIGSTAPIQASKSIKQTAQTTVQQQQQKAKVEPPQKKSQSQKSKIVPSDFVPTRFGLNYNPAAIIIFEVLEYILHGKLYHHKMKLYKLQSETPTNHALEYLKKKHYQYFMGNKIPDKQITSLIEKLKQRIKMGKANVAKPTSASSNRPQTGSTLSGSIQKIPEKAQPQISNNSNQIQMKKEFEDYGQDEDDDSYDEKYKIQQSKIPSKIGQSIQKGQTTYGGKNSNKYEDDYDEDEYDEEYGEQEEEQDGDDYDEMDEDEYRRLYEQMGYNNLDLNKMSNEELNKHKALMEQLYLKNIKRPGDPGYQYDVQAVYNPTMNNEWDMDEDDDADIV